MTRKSILFVFLMYFMNNIYSQNTCDTFEIAMYRNVFL
jgi:hypothetical protein